MCVSKGEITGAVDYWKDQGIPGQLTETLGSGGGLRDTCVCVCVRVCAHTHVFVQDATGES